MASEKERQMDREIFEAVKEFTTKVHEACGIVTLKLMDLDLSNRDPHLRELVKKSKEILDIQEHIESLIGEIEKTGIWDEFFEQEENPDKYRIH
jgi:predicted esterase YcpF (UPF0227 family)